MTIEKNYIYNLIGLGLPLFAALVTIPYLILSLGAEKFGTLTLVWAILSYAGLLDLGLSKAITYKISIFLSEDRTVKIPNFFKSASFLLVWCSVFVASILVAFSSHIATVLGSGFDTPLEARLGIYCIALAIPFVTLTSIYRGVLEAKEFFLVINLIRIPMGLTTFIGPAAVAFFFGADLLLVVIVLVLTRITFYVVHRIIVRYLVVEIKNPSGNDWAELRSALRVGGWMTLTNIVSSLMGYIDRFVLALTVGNAAVAHYVTPQEITTKLWIIPAAITATIFPIFSKAGISGSANVKLFWRSLLLIFIPLFPIVLVLYIFAYEIMGLWISAEFSEFSAPVLQVLVIGIFINCFSHVPFTHLQGIGKARLTAIVQLVQLPLFVVTLYFLSNTFGVIGVAYAVLIRTSIDFILLFSLSFFFLSSKLER